MSGSQGGREASRGWKDRTGRRETVSEMAFGTLPRGTEVDTSLSQHNLWGHNSVHSSFTGFVKGYIIFPTDAQEGVLPLRAACPAPNNSPGEKTTLKPLLTRRGLRCADHLHFDGHGGCISPGGLGSPGANRMSHK